MRLMPHRRSFIPNQQKSRRQALVKATPIFLAEARESRMLLSSSTASLATLASLTGGSWQDRHPVDGLVADASGDLYGTSLSGGTYGNGTIYEVNAETDTLTTLYSFTGGADGASPDGGLVFNASDQNLYGTTQKGGTNGNGTIFTFPVGAVNPVTLYSFTGGGDGSSPNGSLIFDASNNLYGTTRNGGSGGWGTVFRYSLGNLTQPPALATLEAFSGGNGQTPWGALTFAPECERGRI